MIPCDFSTVLCSNNIVLKPGNYRVSKNLVVERECFLTIQSGAIISVDSDCTLTILGTFNAPLVRIFEGGGHVVGIRRVHPEWWGLDYSGQGDQQPSFQLAITCLEYSKNSVGKRPTLVAPSGKFQLSKSIVIRPTKDFNIDFKGAGSTDYGTCFMGNTNFPDQPIICIEGSNVEYQQATDFKIRDFCVLANPQGIGAATRGIRVGTPATEYKLEGYHWNLIENVRVMDYPTAWEVVHCRQIHFNRCSGWNQIGIPNRVSLLINQLGGFTGDHRFTYCQFVGNEYVSGTNSIRIISNFGKSHGATSGNMIAGIKFDKCDIYQADKKVVIYSGQGSWIADIWMDGCQLDGSSNQDLYIECNSLDSKIDNIQLPNNYLAGGNLSKLDQISIISTAGGVLQDIKIIGGTYQLAQGRSLYANFVNGITISGATFRDNNNTQGPVIEICNSLRANINSNTLNRVTNNFSKYFIKVGSGTNYSIVKDNIGIGIVSDQTVVDSSGLFNNIIKDNL